MACGAPGPQFGGHVDDLHREARGAQAIGDVGGVEADVVVLEKLAAPVCGRRDARVLVGRRVVQRERDHDERPAARRGDPAQLAHRRRVVGYVLEHVRADDGVERVVGQVERRHVEAPVGRLRGVEVARDVAQTGPRRQAPAQTPLRREVQ